MGVVHNVFSSYPAWHSYLKNLRDMPHGLENGEVREGLHELLDRFKPRQLGLFAAPDPLDEILDEILVAQKERVRLYNQFSIQKSKLPEDDAFVAKVLEAGAEHPKFDEVMRMLNPGKRVINNPIKPVQRLLREYLLPFLRTSPVHEASHGCEPGYSPIRSLQVHKPAACALTCDLRSASDNIDPEQIFGYFYERLEDTQYREQVAGWLTMITTVRNQGRFVLPQGGAHSAALYNRIWLPLDTLIAQQAEDRHIRYTRFFDDLTFTSRDERDVRDFLGALDLIEAHFPVAEEKTYFQRERIYTLGCVLEGATLRVNSRQEKIREKAVPLDRSKVGVYEPWRDG